MPPRLKLLQPGNLQETRGFRVNWKHPLAAGLVYLEMFDVTRPAANDYPYMPSAIGSHGALTIGTGTASQRPGPGGIGISNSTNQGGVRVTTGSLVRVPQTKGSFFAYVTADHTANDGVSHYVAIIGKESASTEKLLTAIKFSDNNYYFGWFVNGVSYRCIASAAGFYAAGDTFTIGGTWNASNVHGFIKGKLVGSLGSAPTTGDTTAATAVYRIGNSSANNVGWGSILSKNFIYYVAMWDRDLSADECNYLNQNPYCFLTAWSPATLLFEDFGSAVFQGSGNFSASAALLQAGSATLPGAGDLNAQASMGATIWSATAALTGAGDLMATALLTMVAAASHSGVGNFAAESIIAGTSTVWPSSALLAGSGNFSPIAGRMNMVAALDAWSASGELSALAVKPPNRIAARFAGTGGLNVVTIAPRLVASAQFVGDGLFIPVPNSAGYVLSTRFTRRLSFPVDPSVPFVRRPSATYHHGAARLVGAGGLSAIAS